MGVWRLAYPTRSRELGNAVLAIGLLSGEAKGDGITENVANLRLLLKQSEHVGRGPKSHRNACRLFAVWAGMPSFAHCLLCDDYCCCCICC